jgi:PPM family protein phosphatase
MWQLEAVGLSDVGCVRANNEDAFGMVESHGLVVVADGLGGHAAGEVASSQLMDRLLSSVRSSHRPQKTAEAGQFMARVIGNASRAIYEMGQKDPALTGMGTTCCCLWICPDGVALAHVGDSRIYRLRQGVLEQLTRDHVVDLQDMHPFYSLLSGNVGRVLTRAIGSRPEVEVELATEPLQEGDLFLLCSDGLSDMVTGDQIRQCLIQDISIQKRANRLVEMAKMAGGVDNITLVLAYVRLS